MTAIVLAAFIILPLIVIGIGRGINAARLAIRDGVQERLFVTLGDIEQVIHVRGRDANNPVIIWLHGGPGWSDAYELAHWQYPMEHDYTFIRWDQRGSGRTYLHNPDAPLSLDILIADVADLVDYAIARFGRPVYIVGDSWGTVLGITYASRHPEKIAGFVGVAQVIDDLESTKIGIETGIERAMAAGNTGDAEQMRAVYQRIQGKSPTDEDVDFNDFSLAQSLPSKYLAPSGTRYENQGLGILFSPWFGFPEIKQLVSVFTINGSLFADRNKPLFDAIGSFVPPERLEVPVAFIMGGEDFITPTALVADYCNRVEAPSKNMFVIEGTGHSPYRAQPEVFAEMLDEALTGFYRAL